MKPLEALEIIKKASTKSSGWMDDPIEYVYSYEINIIEESLKALEIIKEHVVFREDNVLEANFKWLIKDIEMQYILRKLLK